MPGCSDVSEQTMEDVHSTPHQTPQVGCPSGHSKHALHTNSTQVLSVLRTAADQHYRAADTTVGYGSAAAAQ